MKQNRWLKKRFLFFAATVSLGAGYFLFEYVEENPPIAVPTLDDKEEADYYGFQLKHRQFSKEGVLSQELSATDSKHFPLSDSTLFSEPQIMVTSDNGEQWQIDALQGQQDDRKQRVTLSNTVEIRPIDPRPNEDILVKTDLLHYNTNTQIAETDKLVKITSTNAAINAQGMLLSIPEQTMNLIHQVNTRYVPPTTE